MNVHVIVRIALLSVIRSNESGALSVSTNLPCHFLDSINITDGALQPNKSIIYDGVAFPNNQYAKIDYILKSGEKRTPVEPHYRGCLCNLKPCMRVCCPHGSILEINNEDSHCLPHKEAAKFEGKIVDPTKNETMHVQFDQHFAIVDNFPCSRLFEAPKELYNFQITHVRV